MGNGEENIHADIGASRVKETTLSLELLSLNKALCTFFGIQANSSSNDQCRKTRLN